MEVVFAIMIQKPLTWETNDMYLNNFSYYIFIGIAVLFPLWHLFFLAFRRKKLTKKHYVKHYSYAFQPKKLNLKRPYAVVWPLVYLYRRAATAVILFYFRFDQAWKCIDALLLLHLCGITYTLIVKPFSSKRLY